MKGFMPVIFRGRLDRCDTRTETSPTLHWTPIFTSKTTQTLQLMAIGLISMMGLH
jgi:hypothetical protein